jgi:chromosome segregation ATPase
MSGTITNPFTGRDVLVGGAVADNLRRFAARNGGKDFAARLRAIGVADLGARSAVLRTWQMRTAPNVRDDRMVVARLNWTTIAPMQKGFESIIRALARQNEATVRLLGSVRTQPTESAASSRAAAPAAVDVAAFGEEKESGAAADPPLEPATETVQFADVVPSQSLVEAARMVEKSGASLVRERARVQAMAEIVAERAALNEARANLEATVAACESDKERTRKMSEDARQAAKTAEDERGRLEAVAQGLRAELAAGADRTKAAEIERKKLAQDMIHLTGNLNLRDDELKRATEKLGQHESRSADLGREIEALKGREAAFVEARTAQEREIARLQLALSRDQTALEAERAATRLREAAVLGQVAAAPMVPPEKQEKAGGERGQKRERVAAERSREDLAGAEARLGEIEQLGAGIPRAMVAMEAEREAILADVGRQQAAIAASEGQVAILRGQLESAAARYTESDAKVGVLTEERRACDAELQVLKAKMSDGDARLGELARRNDALAQELANAISRLREMQSTYDAFVSEHGAQSEESRARDAEHAEELQKSKDALAEMAASLARAREATAASEAIAQRLKEADMQKERVSESLRDKVAEVEAENALIARELEVVTSKKLELGSTVDRFHAAMDKQAVEYNALNLRVAQLGQEKDSIGRQLESKVAEIEAANAKHVRLEDEIAATAQANAAAAASERQRRDEEAEFARNQLDAARRGSAAADAEARRLQDLVVGIEAAKEKVLASAAAAHATLVQQNAEIARGESRRAQLEIDIQRIADNMARAMPLEDNLDIQRLENEKGALSGLLRQIRGVTVVQEARIDDSNAKAKDLQIQLDRVSAELAARMQAIETVKGDESRATSERDELRVALAVAEVDRRALQEKLDLLKEEWENLVTEKTELARGAGDLKRLFADMQKEIEGKKIDLKDVRRRAEIEEAAHVLEVARLQKIIDDGISSLDRSVARAQRLEADVANLERRIGQVEAARAEDHVAHSKFQARLEAEKGGLRANLTEQGVRMTKIERDLQESAGLAISLDVRLNACVSNAQERIAEKDEQLRQSFEVGRALDAELARCTAEVKKLGRDNHKLATDFRRCEVAKQVMETLQDQTKSEIARLQAANDALDGRQKELEVRYEAMEKEHRKQRFDERENAKQLRVLVESAQVGRKQCHEDLLKKSADYVKMEKEMKAAAAELEGIRKDIAVHEQSRRENDATIVALNEKIAAGVHNLGAANTALITAADNKAKLDDALKKLEKENAGLRDQIERLTAHLGQSNAEIEVLGRRNELTTRNLAAADESLRAATVKLGNAEGDLQRAFDEIQTQQERNRLIVMDAEEKIRELSAVCDVSSVESRQLLVVIGEREKELADVRRRYDEIVATLASERAAFGVKNYAVGMTVKKGLREEEGCPGVFRTYSDILRRITDGLELVDLVHRTIRLRFPPEKARDFIVDVTRVCNLDYHKRLKTEYMTPLDDFKDPHDVEHCALAEKLIARWVGEGEVEKLNGMLLCMQERLEEILKSVQVYVRVKNRPAGVPVDHPSLLKFAFDEKKRTISKGRRRYGPFHSVFDDKWTNENLWAGTRELAGGELVLSDPRAEGSKGVHSVFSRIADGHPMVLFSYGLSGSGKSYTLWGNKEPFTKGVVQIGLENLRAHSIDIAGIFELYAHSTSTYTKVLGNVIMLRAAPDIRSKVTRIMSAYASKMKEKTSRLIDAEEHAFFQYVAEHGPLGRKPDMYETIGILESYRMSRPRPRVKETPFNKTSSRSHLVVIFEIRFTAGGPARYLVVMDMAGKEDPNAIKAAFFSNPDQQSILTTLTSPPTAGRYPSGFKPPSSDYAYTTFVDILREGIYINETIHQLSCFLIRQSERECDARLMSDEIARAINPKTGKKPEYVPAFPIASPSAEYDMLVIKAGKDKIVIPNTASITCMIPMMLFFQSLDAKPAKFVMICNVRWETEYEGQTDGTLEFAELIGKTV